MRVGLCVLLSPSSVHRANEMVLRMHHDNFHQPHSTTGTLPPATRLGFAEDNVVRNYSQAQTLLSEFIFCASCYQQRFCHVKQVVLHVNASTACWLRSNRIVLSAFQWSIACDAPLWQSQQG